MAFVTVLMRWPDREQPMKYVEGFEILGDISLSHVFRPIKGIPVQAMEHEFFGAPAREAVKELLKAKRPKDSDIIFNMTEDEIANGVLHGAQDGHPDQPPVRGGRLEASTQIRHPPGRREDAPD